MPRKTYNTASPDEMEGTFKSRQRQGGRFAGKRWAEIKFDPNGGEWLVQGLLPLVGLAVFYGRKKVFKSFVALSLGAAIAGRRETWAGRPIKRYGTVIYIAGEGGAGVRKRITGLKQAHPDLATELPFILIEARPNLGVSHGDVDELLASIRAQLTKNDGPPVLVIIDTLVRTLHGADENGDGMRNFADNAEQVAEHLGCLVIAVHHQGSGDGMRGHTSLPGASVTNWHIEPLKNSVPYKCRLMVEDAKDGESGLVLIVTLRRHFFGDPEHDPECPSTLVVESIEIESADHDPSAAKTVKSRPPPGLQAFMTSVEIALHRFGIEFNLPDDGVKVKGVAIEFVRKTYYAKREDLHKQDSKETAFARQSKAAIERELLVSGRHNGTPMVWQPWSQTRQPT
jgi:hypothetical protein